MVLDILCLNLFSRPIRLDSDVIAVAVDESVELRKKFSLVFKGFKVSISVPMDGLIL